MILLNNILLSFKRENLKGSMYFYSTGNERSKKTSSPPSQNHHAKTNPLSILLVTLAFVLIATVDAEYTNVQPCNEVCPRSQAEINECCRAHGYKSDGYCARRKKCKM
ncbi:Diapause-specific peptide [Orchesella cincta]|uniref:Diapause-specific peptide n=1 Tax=Orchesella cincta TaxID=48709 RepID=A0A1D2M1T0_ORCCI|nr:Diapause-specific peptide [Orchesella cincta]